MLVLEDRDYAKEYRFTWKEFYEAYVTRLRCEEPTLKTLFVDREIMYIFDKIIYEAFELMHCTRRVHSTSNNQ